MAKVENISEEPCQGSGIDRFLRRGHSNPQGSVRAFDSGPRAAAGCLFQDDGASHSTVEGTAGGVSLSVGRGAAVYGSGSRLRLWDPFSKAPAQHGHRRGGDGSALPLAKSAFFMGKSNMSDITCILHRTPQRLSTN